MLHYRIFFIICFFLIVHSGASGSPGSLEEWLIPRPREISAGNGFLEYRQGRIICNDIIDPEVYPVVKSVQSVFQELGHFYPFSAIEATGEIPVIRMQIDSNADIRPQGYRLNIDRQSVLLVSRDKPGLFYGVQTLKQIVAYASANGRLPVVRITDWPDFERRGVLLDVNKDQVPTMETFRNLIDLLASWKINEFQLFFKYAFAFVNHPEVSQKYSPVTAEQIVELNHYCRERFIDLVPYHDGFGKLSEWMKYDRYRHLAECPDGCETRWGKYGPSSLSPAVPASLDLVDEIYRELLPNYSSRFVNIGSDETVELGIGRSREMCEKQGVGRVYLNFLKEVKTRASRNGQRVQFWGDIIINHPELIPEIPKDMIPMVWGYEANQPVESEIVKFRDSGLEFYVCPGTSSWNSVIGRLDVAVANLRNAAELGRKYKAMGYLNTNWGEYGNWHPISVCYPGYLYGAAVSWALDNNKEIDIPFLLNKWVFNDPTGITGDAVVSFGKAHSLTEVKLGNNNIFNYTLTSVSRPMKGERFDKLTLQSIERADSSLAANISKLTLSSMSCRDAFQVTRELVLAAELCRHACRIMKNKVAAGDGTLNHIPETERRFLITDLTRIIATHRDIWIGRNRVGGLEESTGKLQNILKFYQELELKNEK